MNIYSKKVTDFYAVLHLFYNNCCISAWREKNYEGKI